MRLALQERGRSLTIPEISQAEGISRHNVAKYLSALRKGGFVASERGQRGGYTLARPPGLVDLSDVLATLGDPLYDPGFCAHHTGLKEACQHAAPECSLRKLWMRVQGAIDEVLAHVTLQDMIDSTGAVDAGLPSLASSARHHRVGAP